MHNVLFSLNFVQLSLFLSFFLSHFFESSRGVLGVTGASRAAAPASLERRYSEYGTTPLFLGAAAAFPPSSAAEDAFAAGAPAATLPPSAAAAAPRAAPPFAPQPQSLLLQSLHSLHSPHLYPLMPKSQYSPAASAPALPGEGDHSCLPPRRGTRRAVLQGRGGARVKRENRKNKKNSKKTEKELTFSCEEGRVASPSFLLLRSTLTLLKINSRERSRCPKKHFLFSPLPISRNHHLAVAVALELPP